MNLLKKLKQIEAEVKAGRKTMKELETARKKWEAAGCPGLEKK